MKAWTVTIGVIAGTAFSAVAHAEEAPPSAPPASPGLSAHRQMKELRSGSLDHREALQTSVLTAGIVSVVGGIVMTIPDDLDQGIRYAGFNTIAFGTVNTIVGAVALYGIAEERREWEEDFNASTRSDRWRYREHALGDESREAWSHALNLGLAGAYASIGGLAIIVSRLDVAHPNRWLGSGIAITAQAAHLAAVDLIGTLTARCYEERMREVAPIVHYDPETGATQAQLTYQSVF